jgi:superfamily II DNA or RNA helicase
LVLTPSRLVREQLAENFRSLVDLRKLAAIDSVVRSPEVATVAKYLQTAEAWAALEAFDVVVATVPSVSPRIGFVANPPPALFDLILVDEAHHSPARTWAALLRELSTSRQCLFTATPYRRDEKELGGKIVFQYDMKRARDDGVFGEIRFEPVSSERHEPADAAIARAVAARFANDRAAGLKHLVMVRADTPVAGPTSATRGRGKLPHHCDGMMDDYASA